MNELHKKDITYLVHPQTNLALHERQGPAVLARGEGVYVEDDQGKRYIEGVSGLWCTALGYSEERLIEAAVRQLRTLPYGQTFAHRSNAPTIELAEKLVQMAPVPMSKALFQSSGSEANDTAIKLAWYYHHAQGKPGKRKIIGRQRGYHGTGLATASVTGLPHMHEEFNLPFDWVLHVDCPHYYRFGRPGESEAQFTERMIGNVEALIEKEGADNIAAFFAEPIMGVGGVVVPPSDYFPRLNVLLERHDILLIADEVICGFGRTGQLWGSQTVGMRPDILTSAKALSSAYLPISATLMTESIYQAMVQQSERLGIFGHGYTYGGHPVCAAVALEALKIYEERDIAGQARAKGDYLASRLEPLREHPLVGDIRGAGLLMGIELVRDKSTKAQFEPSQGVAKQVVDIAEAHGLLIRPIAGDTIAIAPPLIIEEAQLDEIVTTLSLALDRVATGLEAA
ncbi:aminotransferase [Halomonas sp. M5N1S17]|uniref:aminotransferase n=1 Tax=Halomonas alkalisoli TaxID=2907158 RepID=UPI001F3C4094|nr:aminotransferase [Halomonas alkalisoli]MCE9664697.1 aminotransferase [Halomonas alkalisoli]